MSVYVDDMRAPFQSVPWKRQMVMCHMIADTPDELAEIAAKLDLDPRWRQSPGTYREHFDICLSKRKLAVKLGAKELSKKALAQILMNRRRAALKGE